MTNNPASSQEQEAWGLETRLVHGGSLRSQFAETSEALFLTQSYVYASAEQAEERFKSEAGFIYSRYAIASTLIDGRDLGAWQRAMRPNTKAVFFETPANPTLDLVDIAAVSEIAHKAGALVVVDNVFATPVLQKPLKLGADVVVYSATKHVDGQGRCLGGIVLGSQAYVKDHLHNFLKHTGPSLSPFNAWVMLKGLETLPLRVRAQCDTAAKIADHLAGQKS